ncbi:putative C6 transcription factor [Venturia nashicola]|uniref:Putative C6 transcription factor n=1 Tax=Venturia nashicola TaxID=86259 RepID=A0A4Z1NVN1_9PEZI|nr:putative C6 transcription factor [Venturia nashicola]TLD29686.1 putative C6 transcription factor [Venturia nashicola]
MSTSRKSHRKTRTGCVSCKQRKVKCDELRPSCTNCTRRYTPCVYLPTVPPVALASPASTASQRPSPATSSSRALPTHHPTNPGSHVTLAAQPSARPFDMLQLELLHNWSTSTCYTLSPDAREEYRIEAPKFAFAHPFVMHAIMAISALHLAYLRHERRDYYLFHAKAHHEAGLRTASGLLGSMNEKNCVPMWLFSTLCCMFATARPRNFGDFVIVGAKGDADCPFGPMFQTGAARGKLRDKATLENDVTASLRQNISDSGLDKETLALYNAAIDELRKCFAVVYSQTKPELGDVFRWLWEIDDNFIQHLHDKKPAALSILAHFAVLTHSFSSLWWMEGFSRHIVATVYRFLDHSHRHWVRWPIQEVGGIPE